MSLDNLDFSPIFGLCVNGSNPQGENSGDFSEVECEALQNDPQGNARLNSYSFSPVDVKGNIVKFEAIATINGITKHLGYLFASKKVYESLPLSWWGTYVSKSVYEKLPKRINGGIL